MGAGLATFDESWHRVAERFIRLRPGVKIVAQRFRGQRWYVVCDALGNRFFRIRPPAYRFICELEKSDTVNAAWQKILGLTPEDAPGQSEVVQLLSQLHQLGLLRSDLEGDVVALFKAAQKKAQSRGEAAVGESVLYSYSNFQPRCLFKSDSPCRSSVYFKMGVCDLGSDSGAWHQSGCRELAIVYGRV